MSYADLVARATSLNKTAFVPLTEQAMQAAAAPADPAMAAQGAPMPPAAPMPPPDAPMPPQGAPMDPAMAGGAPMPPQQPGGAPPSITGDPNIDMMIAQVLMQQGCTTDGQTWYDPSGQPITQEQMNQILTQLQSDPAFMQAIGMDPAQAGAAPGAPAEGGMPPQGEDPLAGVVEALLQRIDQLEAELSKRITAIGNKVETNKNILDDIQESLGERGKAQQNADDIANETENEIRKGLGEQAQAPAAEAPGMIDATALMDNPDLLNTLGIQG